ncbi:MAG: SH3 domain-containing protein [Lachnospiraceae bacterium]|nr:SH3 domain-containing protein [Lachnospiraceae bacterium]
MKHKCITIAIIFLLLLTSISSYNEYKAFDVPSEYDEMEELLSSCPNGAIMQLRFQSIVGAYHFEGEEAAMAEIKYYGFYDRYGNRCLDSRIIQYFVTNYNAFGDYVEELQSMGYTDVDYTPVTSSTPITPPAATETPVTPAGTPVPAQTAFTVAPLDPPKTMWATQQVNYRDGADTTYNKVGQLNQHDQITVTGIASTNWYQFSLDGGTTQVYASNNYFTDVDPSNRSVIIDNPETGDFSYYEFSETDPSLIDKAIEQLEEEAAQKESELADVTTEVPTEEVVETVEETVAESSETQPALTEELPVTIEVVEEETEELSTVSTSITETVSQLSWTYIITAAILVGIIVLGIVMVIKYRKNRKED